MKKIQKPEPKDDKIYQFQFKDSDGVITIWKYNLHKNQRGPVEVELVYPKDYQTVEQRLNMDNSSLPKTKQQYLNPNNGKMVGYYRAKTLGLVD
jgi:hypothetical protein